MERSGRRSLFAGGAPGRLSRVSEEELRSWVIFSDCLRRGCCVLLQTWASEENFSEPSGSETDRWFVGSENFGLFREHRDSLVPRTSVCFTFLTVSFFAFRVSFPGKHHHVQREAGSDFRRVVESVRRECKFVRLL